MVLKSTSSYKFRVIIYSYLLFILKQENPLKCHILNTHTSIWISVDKVSVLVYQVVLMYRTSYRRVCLASQYWHGTERVGGAINIITNGNGHKIDPSVKQTEVRSRYANADTCGHLAGPRRAANGNIITL